MAVLVTIAVAASRIGRLGVGAEVAWVALRAIVQLSAVSLILVAALSATVYALGFVAVMFAIGVYTTAKRTGVLASGAWPWTAVAMAVGVTPVLAVIYGLGVAPFNGPGIVPIASIMVGNMMTAHTLAARRAFTDLRSGVATYEAALSIGLPRPEAIAEVTSESSREAMVPSLDQTRTVGLVTLPGAFIGVLMGGGSPLQAGAAQVLVLIGVLTGQAMTVTAAHAFVRRAWLLPPDLVARLRP
ncbi:MAG: ABC transporter permease [Propionibacteriaceae bacterium]|nr:ABC transporter permease [Propionibacteriaceae bacterium]